MITRVEISRYVLDVLNGIVGAPLVLLPAGFPVLGRILCACRDANETTVELDISGPERAGLDYCQWRVPKHLTVRRGVTWALENRLRSWRWSLRSWRRRRSWRFVPGEAE